MERRDWIQAEPGTYVRVDAIIAVVGDNVMTSDGNYLIYPEYLDAALERLGLPVSAKSA